MKQQEEWEHIGWLESARKLVEWINQRPSDERILLFLRHSHREVIADHSVQFSTGLTDIGRRMSYELGKRLSIHNPVQFFISFVPRCYETAGGDIKGLSERGGIIGEMEPLPILVKPAHTDDQVWENLQPDGRNITEFVNNWADGEFGDKMQNFEDYKEQLVSDTIARLLQEKEPVLHIHVTHDLALMAMKRILLQRPIEPDEREPFLGGICVSIDKDGFHYQHI